MNQFLTTSEFIDFEHSAVRLKAQELAESATTTHELVNLVFRFVRDEIKHSSDFKLNPVTCRASDVLLHGTGYCYAKSHLVAALLRANSIPTGLCYQRLSVSGDGEPYCLHGLNAVLLSEHGWYRIDARGNKPGVAAEFTPPVEALAFPVRSPQERDLPEIWSEPLPCVVSALRSHSTYDEVLKNLPDIQLLRSLHPASTTP